MSETSILGYPYRDLSGQLVELGRDPKARFNVWDVFSGY